MMTEDNSHNDLRTQLKDKLGNFEAPVPKDGWARVDATLRPKQVVPLYARRRWLAGIAAVALCVLGTGLYWRYVSLDSGENATSPQVVQHHTAPDVPSLIESEEPATLLAEESTLSQPVTSQKKVRRQLVEPELSVIESVVVVEEALPIETAIPSDVSPLVQSITMNEDAYTHSSSGDDYLDVDENDGARRDPQIGAVSLVARGGMSGYHQTSNSPMILRSAMVEDEPRFAPLMNTFAASIQSADNEADKEHDQPLSIGLLGAFPITPSLSVETGLMYSLLNSKVRNRAELSSISQTQQFHYLGVPLNLNYIFYQRNNLKVYATVGAMVERDVYGSLKSKSHFYNETIDAEDERWEKTTIKQVNPQWSVHGGLSISYPLIDKISVYGKIGGSYYFEANNPHTTIYSDKQLMLDLNFGLRYDF